MPMSDVRELCIGGGEWHDVVAVSGDSERQPVNGRGGRGNIVDLYVLIDGSGSM